MNKEVKSGTLSINKIALFQGKQVRKVFHEGEWWFAVVDVVGILTDQIDDLRARKYWNKLSQRLRVEGNQLVTICHQLKMIASDGKMRLTDCANSKGLFRLIQSIPSPKAEPFKMWLAQVGHERLEEIENPELAQERMKKLYEQKAILKTGLINAYEVLPFARIWLMSGASEASANKKILPF